MVTYYAIKVSPDGEAEKAYTMEYYEEVTEQLLDEIDINLGHITQVIKGCLESDQIYGSYNEYQIFDYDTEDVIYNHEEVLDLVYDIKR